jgi:hypothetical protein
MNLLAAAPSPQCHFATCRARVHPHGFIDRAARGCHGASAWYKRGRSAGVVEMPKSLSETQIAAYEREGYLAPVAVMSEADARALRAHLETIEAGMGGPLRGDIRHKAHLLFPFLAGLIRHPAILDAVEDLLGPDILCWNTNFFIKEAETPSFVSWHQDSTYWGLEPADIVTAWVALSDSVVANGAMRVVSD